MFQKPSTRSGKSPLVLQPPQDRGGEIWEENPAPECPGLGFPGWALADVLGGPREGNPGAVSLLKGDRDVWPIPVGPSVLVNGIRVSIWNPRLQCGGIGALSGGGFVATGGFDQTPTLEKGRGADGGWGKKGFAFLWEKLWGVVGLKAPPVGLALPPKVSITPGNFLWNLGPVAGAFELSPPKIDLLLWGKRGGPFNSPPPGGPIPKASLNSLCPVGESPRGLAGFGLGCSLRGVVKTSPSFGISEWPRAIPWV